MSTRPAEKSGKRASTAGETASVGVRVASRLNTVWLKATSHFRFIGKRVSIHPLSWIGAHAARSIWIGNDVEIGPHVHLEVEMDREESAAPTVVIEDGCLLSCRVEIRAGSLVHLEKGVTVMQEAMISNREGEHENIHEGDIRIGQGSWIGPGAAIVSSAGAVTLGRHCVVSANAVVTKSAPPYSVLSGNPATVIRRYDPEKKMWVRGSLLA